MRLATGTIWRGWALAEQGHTAEAMGQMLQGISAARDAGREVKRPYFLALLAEACGNAEEAEERLRPLAEAPEFVQATEERYYEAKLHRLRGELLLACGPEHQTEAESCFRQALDIARRQSAKSLEPQAAMSLSRLWQQHGVTLHVEADNALDQHTRHALLVTNGEQYICPLPPTNARGRKYSEAGRKCHVNNLWACWCKSDGFGSVGFTPHGCQAI